MESRFNKWSVHQQLDVQICTNTQELKMVRGMVKMCVRWPGLAVCLVNGLPAWDEGFRVRNQPKSPSAPSIKRRDKNSLSWTERQIEHFQIFAIETKKRTVSPLPMVFVRWFDGDTKQRMNNR